MAMPRAIPSPNQIADRGLREILAAMKENLETAFQMHGADRSALLVAEAKRIGLVGIRNGVLYSPLVTTAEAASAARSTVTTAYIRRITFNAADGSNAAIGTHNLGFSLPTGHRITRSWLEVTEAFTSATGAATIVIGLDDGVTPDDNAILATTTMAALTLNALLEGIQLGTTISFSALMTLATQVTLTVEAGGAEPLLTGKLTLVLEYMQVT